MFNTSSTSRYVTMIQAMTWTIDKFPVEFFEDNNYPKAQDANMPPTAVGQSWLIQNRFFETTVCQLLDKQIKELAQVRSKIPLGSRYSNTRNRFALLKQKKEAQYKSSSCATGGVTTSGTAIPTAPESTTGAGTNTNAPAASNTTKPPGTTTNAPSTAKPGTTSGMGTLDSKKMLIILGTIVVLAVGGYLLFKKDDSQ